MDDRLTAGTAVKRHEIVLLTMILAAGLAARLYYFGGTYASDDLRHVYHSYFLFQPEARQNAELPCNKGVCYFRMGVNLPLSLVIWLFGPREWALALVPLAASLASIALVFALLRRLSGPTVGLLGAGMYAFLPADIYVATVWLQDDLFVCFFALLLLCLVRGQESAKHGRIWAVAAGLALGYMQICKESAFLLLGVVALWSVFETWKSRRFHFAAMYTLLGFLVSQVLVGFLFYFLEGDFYYYLAHVYNTIRDVRARIPAAYNYGQVLGFLGSYAFTQWDLGFATVVLPVTAFLAFLNRNIKYRLLIGLVFLAQLVIVCEPMRWTPFQQRYMLQLTLPFVLVTALGAGSALQWLPAAWRRCFAVLVFVLLVGSGVLALDAGKQQYNRARAESLRRVFVYLADNAEEDEPIYMDYRAWKRAQRVLYQFNGFQRLKGGFRSINEAYEAKSGWVVLSCFDDYVSVCARWLEVYRCDDTHYWARVYKVLPRRPEWDMAVLRPSAREPLYLPLPDIAEEQFTPVAFDEPAETYRSDWGADRGRVTLASQGGGLRVHIDARGTTGYGAYGGVRFFTAGLSALRFSTALHNPNNVKAVFVDGCDGWGRRLTRWEWQVRKGRRPTDEPETFVLVPGKPAAYFRPVGEADPNAINEVHVFIQIDAGREAGFVLRDVAVVSTPRPQPNLDAYSLRPVDLSPVADDHRSHWSSGAKHVSLRRIERGIACTLETAADAPTTGLYGGVVIPVAGLQALRMTAGFEHVENIDAVYVDGYDGNGKRVLRWGWRLSPACRPGRDPTEFAFVPGQRSGSFAASGGGDGDAVEELHVFVRAKPGTTCGFTLQDVLVAEPTLHSPDLSGYDLQPLSLAESPETYRSRWSAKAANVSLARDEPRGLRCVLETDADAASNACYGGVRLAVPGIRALRLRASFEQPDNIEAIYIDGYGSGRSRVLRWQWSLTPTRRPQGGAAEYNFIPGQGSAYFKPVGDAVGDDARELHIFLQGKPGTTCGFVLHDVLVAAPPLPEPDVSAYHFNEVALVAPAEQWLSPKWRTAQDVSVALTSAGLRCAVTAGPRQARGQYGGIRLSADNIRALRLAVTLLHVENIEAVYVDGYGPDNARVVRWLWRPWQTRASEPAREVWTFVPGKPAGNFECALEESGGPISAVDVFLRVAPEAKAGFVIDWAELAVGTGG